MHATLPLPVSMHARDLTAVSYVARTHRTRANHGRTKEEGCWQTMLAWVQHSSVWRAGTVVDEGGGDSPVSVLLDEGEVLLVSDSEGVQPRNADDAADAEDIATLQHLNEPSILHALAVRYARDAIYTRCGSILIATNPWRRVQALTSRETLCSYVAGCESDPHPFAIARVAYAGALRGERQSILVSGESGSGKTETTKTLLAYLSAAARAGSNGMQDLVATMLLDANPVLEAFGKYPAPDPCAVSIGDTKRLRAGR